MGYSPGFRARIVPAVARLLAPGYGCCRRCRMPWLFVEPHVVEYERHERGGSGAFALCNRCWAETDTHDHVSYMALVHGENEAWMAIQEATLYDGHGTTLPGARA